MGSSINHPSSMNSKSIKWLLTVGVIAIIILQVGCKGKQDVEISTDPLFGEYISAYTSGMISAHSAITIKLTKPSSKFTFNGDEVHEGYFSFSPSVKGKAYWVDDQTLEYRPTEVMRSGKVYSSSLALSKLFKGVEPKLKTFRFSFRVIPQSVSIELNGLIVRDAENPNSYELDGTVQTADVAESEKLNECIKASVNGMSIATKLDSTEVVNTYHLRLEGIERTVKKGEVRISWNTSAIGGNSKGYEILEVPPLGSFKVISAKAIQTPEQSVTIIFSDLLDRNQNFEGLVELEGISGLRYEVDRNMLRVYPPETIEGEKNLNISAGVLNAIGKRLNAEFSQNLLFEDVNPALRTVGHGAILPTTQGLIFSFEAVNLKAVSVQIVKIYESNVPYYLQVNTMGGTNELRRVGYPVLNKVIGLNQFGPIVPNKWTRYTLDLAQLFKADRGAIYQISITFNKKQLLSSCGDDSDQTTPTSPFSPGDEEVARGYDGPGYYDDYYYYYDDDYNWRERDNPCNSAYYSESRMINQIIISSDIGIIAKLGNDGGMLVAVTDLPSAKPLSNANVRISDYQNQTIADGNTNNDGFFEFKTTRRPFLVTASDGKQKGYLRVDNGTSNPLSNFDVSGNEVQHGLKGMIYGERGVWRPGDTLHLCFILEDKGKTLPPNHPVVLELHDPKGLLVKRAVQPNNDAGIFYFPTVTDPQAPTGPWSATVRVGGAIFQKTLKVESIKPNRLKINLELQGNNIPPSGMVNATLNAKWLHGAAAANLKAKYELTVSKANASFPEFSSYSFDDPGIDFPTQTQTLWDGQLDDNGTARVYGSLNIPDSRPAAINVLFKGRVFEPGGDFSIDLFSKTFYPFSELVGVKPPQPKMGTSWLETDTDQQFSVVTINNDGKPISCPNLELELYKLTWRWWWEQPETGEAGYVNRNYDYLISSHKFGTVNGKATVKLRVDYPEWGRYYVKVTNKTTGNSCGTIVYFDWPYSSGKSQANRPGGASILAISVDKPDCKVKESFKLTIPGAENSRALVSIENGYKVVKAFWVDASNQANVVDIQTTPEMTPNVFVHVTLIQPHTNKTNDLPIRLYGITRINVSDPETTLQPVITMPDELKSDKPVEILIREKSGKKMNFTLAMVDEGLLDINRFKTPDPHSVFYAREAIGVKTWDLFDEVIGAYGSTMERLISVGGDEELNPTQGEKIQRFKPVVRFFGPFVLEKGKTEKISFNMGNYFGSVRIMVVAANDGAYGFAEKSCPVKNDLMVMATLPRVLGPQETVTMPISIFTTSPAIKQVKIRVKTSSNLKVLNGNEQNLEFTKPGDLLAFFTLQVSEGTGPARVEVLAEGNGVKSTQVVDIEVRNPISIQVVSIDTLLPPNGKKSLQLSTFGIKGTNEAYLEASVTPPLNLNKRLGYLIQYPHGCVEQTTSAVFPQLYLSQLVDLTADQQKKTSRFVSEAIKKLAGFQNSDGSFRYWPSYVYGDDWSTSYVGHFLLEARSKGYDVPEGMLSRWTSYQGKSARNYIPRPTNPFNSDLVQAYRLYTLALAAKPEVGAMNKLKEQELGLIAKMRLAGAYALIGQKDVALAIVGSVPIKFSPYRELSYTYGSDIRDRGIVLETLILLGLDSKAYPIALEISKALSQNDWMSTQETAVALLALSRLSIDKEKGGELNLSYTLAKNSRVISSRRPVAREQLEIRDGSNTLEIQNMTKNNVYASVVLKGVPAPGNETSYSSNLNIMARYRSASGDELNPYNLKKGMDFTCEVTVSNPGIRGELKELALTQIFPAGWEIQNTRFEGTENVSGSTFDYQDIRDDRVITYFSLKPNERRSFTIRLTATYSGRYYMPGPHCEAMYDNAISAGEKGGWVTVE